MAIKSHVMRNEEEAWQQVAVDKVFRKTIVNQGFMQEGRLAKPFNESEVTVVQSMVLLVENSQASIVDSEIASSKKNFGTQVSNFSGQAVATMEFDYLDESWHSRKGIAVERGTVPPSVPFRDATLQSKTEIIIKTTLLDPKDHVRKEQPTEVAKVELANSLANWPAILRPLNIDTKLLPWNAWQERAQLFMENRKQKVDQASHAKSLLMGAPDAEDSDDEPAAVPNTPPPLAPPQSAPAPATPSIFQSAAATAEIPDAPQPQPRGRKEKVGTEGARTPRSSRPSRPGTPRGSPTSSQEPSRKRAAVIDYREAAIAKLKAEVVAPTATGVADNDKDKDCALADKSTPTPRNASERHGEDMLTIQQRNTGEDDRVMKPAPTLDAIVVVAVVVVESSREALEGAVSVYAVFFTKHQLTTLRGS